MLKPRIFLCKNKKQKVQFLGVIINLFQVSDDPLQNLNDIVKYTICG